MNDEPLVAAEDDIGLLCLVIANGFTNEVLAKLNAAGFGDAKFSHGFIVQGLLAGDRTASELADRLGISIQAVSKTVLEMERLGYLERLPHSADGRSSLLALSPRAIDSIRVSRQARYEVMETLRASLGNLESDQLIEFLRLVADSFGGLAALADRSVRQVNQ